MTCPECGYLNPPTAVRCNCGYKFNAAENTNTSTSREYTGVQVGTGILILGWIFSIMGGLIGILIASHIANAKVRNNKGELVPKYDYPSQQKGKTMLIVAAVVIGIGLLFRIMGSF